MKCYELVIQHIKLGDALKIRDKIFHFHLGLPHIHAYLISIFLDISHSLFCVVNGHFLFQFEIAVIVVNTYYYLRGKGGREGGG